MPYKVSINKPELFTYLNAKPGQKEGSPVKWIIDKFSCHGTVKCTRDKLYCAAHRGRSFIPAYFDNNNNGDMIFGRKYS